MDVPLALNYIEILHGLIGNKKSSTFAHQTDGVGLSVFYTYLFYDENR